jgi:hypothetical protein
MSAALQASRDDLENLGRQQLRVGNHYNGIVVQDEPFSDGVFVAERRQDLHVERLPCRAPAFLSHELACCPCRTRSYSWESTSAWSRGGPGEARCRSEPGAALKSSWCEFGESWMCHKISKTKHRSKYGCISEARFGQAVQEIGRYWSTPSCSCCRASSSGTAVLRAAAGTAAPVRAWKSSDSSDFEVLCSG